MKRTPKPLPGVEVDRLVANHLETVEALLDAIGGAALDGASDAMDFAAGVHDFEHTPRKEQTVQERCLRAMHRIEVARAIIADPFYRKREVSRIKAEIAGGQCTAEHVRRVKEAMKQGHSQDEALRIVEKRAAAKGEHGFSAKTFRNKKLGRRASN